MAFEDLFRDVLQTGADFGKTLLEIELFEERLETEARINDFYRQQEREGESEQTNPPQAVPFNTTVLIIAGVAVLGLVFVSVGRSRG